MLGRERLIPLRLIEADKKTFLKSISALLLYLLINLKLPSYEKTTITITNYFIIFLWGFRGTRGRLWLC